MQDPVSVTFHCESCDSRTTLPIEQVHALKEFEAVPCKECGLPTYADFLNYEGDE